RAEEPLLEHQAGVGGEDKVGQAGLGRQQLKLRAKAFQRGVELLPLAAGSLRRAGTLALHPRVDLILDAVIVGRAHEDAWLLHGAPQLARGCTSFSAWAGRASSATSARKNGSTS